MRFPTVRPVSAKAKAHADAAQSYRRGGDLASARSELERALAIIVRGPRWDRSPLNRLRWALAHADLRSGLGEVSMDQGRPDLARAELELAYREYQRLSHDVSENHATVLNNLGVAYEKLGLVDCSEAALRRAMEIDQRIGASPERIAAGLNNISLTLQSKGYPEEAILALERAAQLAGLPPGVIRVIDNQRSFHLATRGDFARAVVALTQQLDVAETGTIEEAHLAGDLAQTYAALHRWADAEPLHRRGIAVRRRMQPGSLPLAIAVLNHAQTLGELGRPAEAEAAVGEAAGLAERIAPRSGALASIRGFQAWSLLERGRPAEAVRLARAAVDAAPHANRQLTGVRLAAAAGYRQLGRPDFARDWLRTARDECAWIEPPPWELRFVLTGLGVNLLEAGDLDGAADSFDGAIRAAERHRAGSAAEPGLESIFGTAQAAYHGRIEVAELRGAPEDVEAAFRAMEAFRARSLAELLSDVDRRPPPEAAAVLAELDEVQAELGAIYRRAMIDRSPLRTGLEHREERLRIKLRALDPATADRHYPGPCTLRDVQERLDQETCVALYEVTDAGVFLCTVERDTAGFRRLPAPAAEIVTAADEVVAACRDGKSASPAEALERLGRWLLGPLPKTASRVAVCVNGPLAYVPFEALTIDGVACVERRDVWSIPSATTAVRFGDLAVPRRPDVDFVGFAVPQVAGAPPLPSARREVDEIARVFAGDSVVLTGDQVTGAAVRREAPRGRFVHIAAHGHIDDERPLYSGFPLPGGNFLRAHELANLRLSAELVSCSACETAVGASRPGEGIVGLAHALFGAGARAVLVSRWQVRDRVARRLMVAVHERLAAGVPMAAAVRGAVLGERGRHKHPREWAAFSLITIGMSGGER